MAKRTKENPKEITPKSTADADLQQNFCDELDSTNIGPEEQSIGAILRQKREDLKMEIRDVSHRLKVKISDLEALENDDLKSITKHLYIPGLVNSYSRALKIDPKMMEQKVKQLPIRSNTDNKEHQLINIGEESDLSPPKDLVINAFLAAALIMLVLFSIYHSYENRNDLITDKQLISEMENT